MCHSYDRYHDSRGVNFIDDSIITFSYKVSVSGTCELARTYWMRVLSQCLNGRDDSRHNLFGKLSELSGSGTLPLDLK
jgi:hypothetical protein